MAFSKEYYQELGRAAMTGEAPASNWEQESARKAGLPEEFWRYALSRETGGTPNPIDAVSPAGAFGTAQLMPATAQEVGAKYGIDTQSPYGNVLGGAHYMREQLDKAQGWAPEDPELQHRLALSAYNAGPGRVGRVIQDIRNQGGDLSWDAISPKLPPETQSYAGKYSYMAAPGGTVLTPPASVGPPLPSLPPPPALEQESSGGVAGALRKFGEFAEKGYGIPGVQQFGEVMGAPKGFVEENVYKPLLGYKEGTLGSQLGDPLQAGLKAAGAPAPIAGLAGAATSFFADMYTDPLYWGLTAAGSVIGASFGGVGAVPGGAIGASLATAIRNAPRLQAGLVTGLKVAGMGFKGQMGLHAASAVPKGIAEIMEDPRGTAGWRNLGEGGLSGWYATHEFLKKPASQTGRVKVSELLGEGQTLTPMDPARAREVLDMGFKPIGDLIDSRVQELWTAVADQGFVPRTALPELHLVFNEGGFERPRGISEPGEKYGRLGIDLGHLAADVKSWAPEQRAKGLVEMVDHIAAEEVAHLLHQTGMPHDPRLPVQLRKELSELKRQADFSAEVPMSYEQLAQAREALFAKHGVDPSVAYGDPYSIAREILDQVSSSPQRVGRSLARMVGADPDSFASELAANPKAALAKVDMSPVQKLVDGLVGGIDKLQARTMGQLQPDLMGAQRTPAETIARTGGADLRFGPGEMSPKPTLEPPPALMKSEGEEFGKGGKPGSKTGRRGFGVYAPQRKPEEVAPRAVAEHKEYSAEVPKGRKLSEDGLRTFPTPSVGKPTEEMFSPELSPVRSHETVGKLEARLMAEGIKPVPKVEKGRGSRTFSAADVLKGRMRSEGEKDFSSMTRDEQLSHVERLFEEKQISQGVYESAVKKIERGWEKKPYVGPAPVVEARKEFAPAGPDAKVDLPKRIVTSEHVTPRSLETEQLGSGTERTGKKMETFGVWGRLTREQKKVQKEAARVSKRSLTQTAEEKDAAKVAALEKSNKRVSTEDGFRIVLRAVGDKKIDLTSTDREQIKFELGATPQESKVFQVAQKWAKQSGGARLRVSATQGMRTGPPKLTKAALDEFMQERSAQTESLRKLGVTVGPRRKTPVSVGVDAKKGEISSEQIKPGAILRFKSEGEKTPEEIAKARVLKEASEIGRASGKPRKGTTAGEAIFSGGSRDKTSETEFLDQAKQLKKPELPPPPAYSGEIKPVSRAQTPTAAERIASPLPPAERVEPMGPPVRKNAGKTRMLKAAKQIGTEFKPQSVGSKTKSAADLLGKIQPPWKMKSEGEGMKSAAETAPFEADRAPEWLRGAALASQRLKLRKELKQTEFNNKKWDDLKQAFYEGKLPSSASDPMRRLIAIGAQAPEVERLPGVTDWDSRWEKLGAPRALITSLDLSGILRQGAVGTASMFVRHPLVTGRAIAESIKVLGSEKAFERAIKEVESRDDFRVLKALGVDFAKSEEQFTGGRYAEKLLHKLHVPNFVRASERSYTYYLNRLRYELGKHHIDNLRRLGFEDKPFTYESQAGNPMIRFEGKDAELFKKAAQWVNIATGRGGLPQGRDQLSKVVRSADGFLNAVLFSPRLMYARLALFNPNTYLRTRAAAKAGGAGELRAARAALALHGVDLASYFGLVAGMGAAISLLSDDAKVEGDMTSSDFGQIRLGGTRVDVTGGVRTYVTALARLATSQTKTEYGHIKYQAPWDTLTTFLRGKLSPTAGVAVNLAAGTNLVGDPLYATLADVVKGDTPLDKKSLKAILDETGGQLGANLAIPMILTDANKLINEHGWTAPQVVPLMAGMVLGVGVSTRESEPGMTRGLQDTLRANIVSPLEAVGKAQTGIADLMGNPIQIDLTQRQKSEISRLVDQPFYKTLSDLVEKPSFKALPPEAQRIVLISVLTTAKKSRIPAGLREVGVEKLRKEVKSQLVPEEFGRLDPPPAYAKKKPRWTDAGSWVSSSSKKPSQ